MFEANTIDVGFIPEFLEEVGHVVVEVEGERIVLEEILKLGRLASVENELEDVKGNFGISEF